MGEWKNRFRRGMVMALTLAVAGGGTASAVSSMPGGELPGNEDVLVGASLEDIEDAVQGERNVSQERSGAVAYSADGKGLKSADAAIYNALKLSIGEVARGEETSTAFALKTRYSTSTLAQVDVNTIVTYLLNDCPFDLYWHDKTKTIENGKETDGVYCKYYDDGTIVFSFKVSAPYRVSDAELYKVNSAYMGTVDAARQKAQSIVDTNQNCTDYDKLLNYRNAICDLVTYDYEAQQSPLYGNSYQVINVFDDDMYSNVVCEGYAKAFQYLCDLSDFDNDVECHTVTGVTDAGAGAGEHMWNIVKVGGSDGESYLVDVTNCDAGTIGEGTGLFMTDELSGSVESGYTYNNGWSSITYQYGGESRKVYGSQILSLANEDNNEEAKLFVKGSGSAETPDQEDPEGIMRVDVPEDEEEENTADQSDEVKKDDENKEVTTENTSGFKFAVSEVEKIYGDEDFIEQVLGCEGKKVTYTSSDDKVAKVNPKRGKVEIQGAGTAVITAESTGGDKASYTLNVSKKQLVWDISGLYAIDRADKIIDKNATLYGEIKLEGILKDDDDSDMGFESDEYLTGKYSEVVPGKQTVTLNWKEGKKVYLLENRKASNYEMPEKLPELTGKITSITRLPDPQIETSEPEDGLKYKLEMEDGISSVPETLQKDRNLNTPPKIESALKEDLRQEGIPEENVAVYDVSLYWQDKATVPAESEDEEGQSGDGADEENADAESLNDESASDWVKVMDETFPEGGLTVTLPYPGGMPRNVKDIVISHMFVEDMYTSSPGEIEHPADIEETVDGIKFTVYGLSPIAIGWSSETTDTPKQNPQDTTTSGTTGSQNNQNNNNQNNQNNTNNQTNTNTNRSPVTGDTMQILIYAVLVILCGATIKGIQVLRRTGKKHER